MAGININTNFNREIISPNFRAKQNVSKPVDIDDKKGLSTETKWVIGLGLTALASYAIYRMTKGRIKTGNTDTSQVDNIQKQINELKNKIKTNYLEEKNKITQKYFDSGNFTMNECSLLHDKHKKEGSLYHIGPKSIDDLNYLIKDYSEPSGKSYGIKSSAQSEIDNFSKSIKERLSELQKDSDWVELRKMRKQILKNRKARRFDNSIPKDPNESSRLELINDVLYSKYNGKKTNLMERLSLSIDDVIKLIKNPNTNDEYIKILKTNDAFDIEPAIDTVYPLRLSLFTDTSKYDEAKNTIKALNERLNELKGEKSKLHEELKNLAENYRNSDDVKNLQELIKKSKD